MGGNTLRVSCSGLRVEILTRIFALITRNAQLGTRNDMGFQNSTEGS
jgi:hypothetical protein